MKEDRRLKRFAVAPELLANLGSGMYEVVGNELPADSRVVGAGYDASEHLLFVIIASGEFPELPQGCIIPFIEPPVVKKLEMATCE